MFVLQGVQFRVEVIVHFRDRIRQSDETNESDDQQHEADYKKVS